MNNKLDLELSPELEPYRSAIEATIKQHIKIEATDNDNPTWWQSKFGGLPYMPKDFEYPKSNDGEYLHLLAQINFTEVPQLEGLPNKGILQFYLANDEMFGCDFDNPTKQDKFRVIYFSDADLPKEDLVTNFNFLTEIDKFCFPLKGCRAMRFKIASAPISGGDYRFNIWREDDVSDDLYDEYWEKFNTEGHKLLGYPDFTQSDPRDYLFKEEDYILLLQIDSEYGDDEFEISWGDNGIGNFFIKPSNLKKLDFTKILYNWDCC